MKNKNHNQDIEIQRNTIAINNLIKRFDKFFDLFENHYSTIPTDVKWLRKLMWIILGSVAIPLWLFIIYKLLN